HAGARLVSDDYESDAVGTLPAGPDYLSPSSIRADIKAVVIGSEENTAGTGNALRILDDSGTAGVVCRYNLSANAGEQLSTVRIDFSFAPLGTGNNGGMFYIALGEYGRSLTSYRDRFLTASLFDDGSIGLDGTRLLLQTSGNTLSIFVNDLATDILYTGPDDETHTLGADSVAYWLNGSRILFGGKGYTALEDRDTAAGSVFMSTNNIGSFGFVSYTDARSPDYVIDDLVIDELPFEAITVYDGVNGLVYEGGNGLVYNRYSNEGEDNPVNTVPDFSSAGYQGGGVPIPFVPSVVEVSNSNGTNDDSTVIQNAINSASVLSPDSNGFRGAVLIKAGDYTVSRTLKIYTGGVVIRGEGSQAGGTKITYTSDQKSNLFEVGGYGSDPAEIPGTSQMITDSYVPVGANSFQVADASGFAVGDPIRIEYLMNSTWISDLGMDNIIDPDPLVGDESWSASSYHLKYYRTITAIDGDEVTIDAPIVQTIQTRYGGAEIYKYTFGGQIENVGFEG
ncbi:MAG TPA: hypothetical protein VJ904_01730, partial [Tichowtungia sp.]|nr:hypothetical protein [Tichowtungia sp.]